MTERVTEPQARARDESQDYPHWRRNCKAISSGNLLTNLGWTGAFAFLPLVMREMDTGDNLEQWVGVVAFGYFAVSCLFTPVWGVLADHYGRKSMVLRAGLGMGSGFLLLSQVDTPLHFLLLMLCIGLFNGFVPAGQALVATNTPRSRSGGALAMTQGASWMGNMLGPLLAATLVAVLPSYHALFAVAGVTTLTAGIVALLFVREDRAPHAHPLRFSMRADVRRLWQVPQLKALYYISMVFAFSMFGANSVVSLFTLRLLEAHPGFGGLSVDTWVAITAMGTVVASMAALPLWGRALNHGDSGRLLKLQLAGGFAASLLLPLVQDPLQLTLGRVVLAFFISGMPPTLIRMVRDKAPAGMEGRTLSYQTAVQQLGNAFGPLTAGLLAPWLSLRAYFVLDSLLLLAALLLWAWCGRRMQAGH